MKALRDSTDILTHTISTPLTKAGRSTLHSNRSSYSSYRPFNHLHDTTNNKIRKHLDGFGNHDSLERMYQILQDPIRLLSTASNLSSLTIDFLPTDFPTEKYWPPSWSTTFAALLEGCQLSQLSMLHIRYSTSREAEFSTFIQHSPHIHDLSLPNSHLINLKELRPLTHADLGSCKHLLLSIKRTLQHLEHFRVRSVTCYYELNSQVKSSVYNLVLDESWKKQSPRFMSDNSIDPFAETIKEIVSSRDWK